MFNKKLNKRISLKLINFSHDNLIETRKKASTKKTQKMHRRHTLSAQYRTELKLKEQNTMNRVACDFMYYNKEIVPLKVVGQHSYIAQYAKQARKYHRISANCM